MEIIWRSCIWILGLKGLKLITVTIQALTPRILTLEINQETKFGTHKKTKINVVIFLFKWNKNNV